MEQQLPPIYPALINRPLNLLVDDSYNYLLEKKKSFRAQTSELYFNDKIPSEKTDFNALIERYSDKYIKQKKIVDKSWIPEWNLLPKELKYFYERDESSVMSKRKARAVAAWKPPAIKKKKERKIDLSRLDDVADEEEEDKDNEEEKKEKKSNQGSGDEEDEEENREEMEEDEEEENDYIDAYFDNGENYADDDGGGGGDDDGPLY